MNEITKPFIHSNGTSVDDLLNDNCEARSAIEDAITRIQKMEFNGRDYYPIEGSWTKAIAERMEVLKKLRDCSEYFLAIAEHCADAQADRESRRSK
jgi:hypothetical protein